MNLETNDQHYRFNIRVRLYGLDPEDRKFVKELVRHTLHLSEATLNRLIYLKKGEEWTVNYDALKIFATYFDVSIPDLENDTNE